jgi:hypothetical protein
VATYTITTKLTLSSTTGTVGTVVTAKGAGFAANSQITLTFDSTTLTTTPLSVVSDANGRFEASFAIPESIGQAHTIMASDATGGRVSATCTVIPFILLSPNNGRVGSNVVISGTGFGPGGVITITFELGIVATLPPIVEANSMGSFTASFTVPSASPGARTIRASDNIGGSAQATYTVTPLITFTATGRAGTAVTITGTGFAPSNTVSIKFDAVTLASAPTDPTGGFTQVITVPNAPAGSYFISAIDPLGAAASAAFTVTPLITLSPSSGVVGTVLTINGAGFTASSSIVLTFAGNSMTTTPPSITTDPYGAFTASFAAPNNPTGGWSVRAQDSNGLQSVATYTITTKLTLSSTTGTVGTVVTAKGAGFAAGSQVTLTFDAQTLTTTPSTIFADPSGRFEVSFPIPESTGQVHTIVASDSTGNRLSSSYTVSASIKLSPTSGNIGESILLTGAGFGPASLITVTFNSDMVATTPTTIETSPQGSFTAVFSVLTATPGANTVRATDNVGGAATATFTALRKITLSSSSGTPLSSLLITGQGFDPSSTITLTWSSSLLNTVPTPVVSNAAGAFEAIITTPLDVAGAHVIEARDPSGNLASNTYTTTPSILLDPADQGSGDTLRIVCHGFSGNSPMYITWDGTPIVTSPTNIETDPSGSFKASFELPYTPLGNHKVTAVDSLGNYTSGTYTLTSSYPIIISMDVGSIYYRGEMADFLALVSKRGIPLDVTTLKATLIKPDGSTQNLSSAVVNLQKGVYKIDYTIPGNADAGTYALIVNATVTVQDITRYGSALKAFQVSRTFSNMNAMLEEINGSVATISLDVGPILIKLDEVDASLTSLILTEKNEVLVTISCTAGTITSKINALNASLASIENNKASILTDLGSVKTDLKTIGAQIASISGNTAHITSLVGSLNVSLTEISPKLTGIDEGILHLKTDLGRVNVSIQEMRVRSISLEEKTVKIQTDVGSIATTLDGIIGIELPVNTPIGTRGVTLLSNVNAITASFMEYEKTIDIKSTKNSAGSGVISVIIPKEVVTSLGSTASNIKISDNGKDATYTTLEFPEIS